MSKQKQPANPSLGGNEVLRRMLQTPPKPHKAPAMKKPPAKRPPPRTPWG
jgi:hypothetical protein